MGSGVLCALAGVAGAVEGATEGTGGTIPAVCPAADAADSAAMEELNPAYAPRVDACDEKRRPANKVAAGAPLGEKTCAGTELPLGDSVGEITALNRDPDPPDTGEDDDADAGDMVDKDEALEMRCNRLWKHTHTRRNIPAHTNSDRIDTPHNNGSSAQRRC